MLLTRGGEEGAAHQTLRGLRHAEVHRLLKQGVYDGVIGNQLTGCAQVRSVSPSPPDSLDEWTRRIIHNY